MRKRRYITLTEEEKNLLTVEYKGDKVHHYRERCYAILLSSEGHTITEIATLLKKQTDTICSWFNKWESEGLSGLGIKEGRGLKPVLRPDNPQHVEIVKKKIAENPLKVRNLLSNISAVVGEYVSKDMLKTFLKRLGYSYRRIRKVVKQSPSPAVYEAKLAEMTKLFELERDKFLKIYYADETGFSETPNVPYGWQEKNKHLTIPTTKGRRINVFGIMSPDNQLFSCSTQGTINSDFIMAAIDQFTESSDREPRSIIILDNASVHRSKQFKAKLGVWQEQGVEIFYLPPYSPHLNKIETLWRKCKYEWLLPQDFSSWKSLTTKLSQIFADFGSEFTINFAA